MCVNNVVPDLGDPQIKIGLVISTLLIPNKRFSKSDKLLNKNDNLF